MLNNMPSRMKSAFTLIELLVVIAIIGILAAVAVPTLNSFKPNVMAAATQQLLTDLARARQLAIAERTTVYMVFLPLGFPNATTNWQNLPVGLEAKAQKLYDKQLTGYNYLALRALGDQPGQPTKRYLSSWRTLPDTTFIPTWKFMQPPGSSVILTNRTYNGDGSVSVGQISVAAFAYRQEIPFPMQPGATNISLPYVAFNYLGQLESDRDVYIPLAKGNVSVPRSNGVAIKGPAKATETPPNNSIESFNVVYVDRLTGRARSIRQEVK